MPAKPRARWSVNTKTLTAATAADGTFTLQAEVLDGGTAAITVTLTISADRAARLLVHGQPGAQLAGFEAWSDI